MVDLGAAHGSSKLKKAKAGPLLRWGDALSQFARAKKLNWLEAAKGRNRWSALEDEFAAKRW